MAIVRQGLMQAFSEQNAHVLDGLNGEQLMVYFHPITFITIVFVSDAVTVVDFIHELQAYLSDSVHIA